MTTEFNAEHMVQVTKRLCQIIESEISLIDEMKLSELNANDAEKLELTEILESYKVILQNNPLVIQNLSKNVVDEMRETSLHFENLLQQDGKQLRKAKKVHQIIMQTIKDVINKRLAASSSYNRNGLMDIAKKKLFLTPPVSISENV